MSVVLCFVSLLRKSFSFSSLNFILVARINQSDVRAIHVSRELLIRGDRGCVSNVEISYGVLKSSKEMMLIEVFIHISNSHTKHDNES